MSDSLPALREEAEFWWLTQAGFTWIQVHISTLKSEHFVYVTVSRSFPLQSIAGQNLPANITAVLHDLGFTPVEVSRIVN